MTQMRELGGARPLLAKGRISEVVRDGNGKIVLDRGLEPANTVFQTVHAGQTRRVPADLWLKPNGYFAMVLQNDRGLIAPPLIDAVELRLTITLADGRQKSVSQMLTGADLARIPVPVTVAGQNLAGTAIAKAPFTFAAEFDPDPVMLFGTVIADHNPATPVAGATVTAGPLHATSDTKGNFRLGPLPALSSLALHISKNAVSTDVTFHPDFNQAVNLAAFSLDA